MLWKRIGVIAGILASIATIAGALIKAQGSGGNVSQTAGDGGVNVNASPGATVVNAPQTKKTPAAPSIKELGFLFGSWCSSLGGKDSFRAAGDAIEHRFVSEAQPKFGLPAVDTGWQKLRMLHVTFPDGTWIVTMDNPDGSQTQYTKESNEQISARATDTGGQVVTLTKCQ